MVYELDCVVEIHKLRETISTPESTYDGESLIRQCLLVSLPHQYYRQAVGQSKEPHPLTGR